MANPTTFIAGGQTPSQDSGITSFLEFDATVDVATDLRGDISTHPIETGSRVADHFTRENPRFTVTGITSNHPVLPFRERDTRNAVITQGKRTASMFEVITRMYLQGTLFTMVTDLASYDNCIVRSIGNTQEVDMAESLRLDLEIEQIRVVTARRVITAANFVDVDNEETTNAGSKSGDQVPDDEAFELFRRGRRVIGGAL